MNNQNLNKATAMGHILVDELQTIGHEFINNAIGLSVPIINTMAQTNLNPPPKNVNNIIYYRNDDETKIMLCCELPGVSKDDCKLNYDNQILRIQGSTIHNDEWNFVNVKKYYREINVGTISTKNIEAKYENGLLKITITKNTDISSNITIN